MTIFPPYIAISFTFIAFLFPSITHAFGSVATVAIISGTDTVCGIRDGLNLQSIVCYQDRHNKTISMNPNVSFEVISGGNQFFCGLISGNSHACGYNMDGQLICRGRNDTGQLGIIQDRFTPFEYSVLALGIIHSCGIRLWDQKVVCWGGKGEFSSDLIKDISFETIVAGTGFTCGVATSDFSLICWGPVWNMWNKGVVYVPNFPKIVPSPCVQEKCPCNYYAGCAYHCSSGCMCMRCCPWCSGDAARRYRNTVSPGKVAGSAVLPS
ncbi:putative serine/threonine-protein kinase-like protein CCR3 [Macadamia integrifolia]|uniref:putative serine/threonine-protein kinase-like protein CCR3 n=1 Tax=Macadamia integrifolia TaxID=60698 RepID=UPI001C4F8AE4|nr:putative serine/threonine-protein kinase-like protein CCR3 [Macadamia integrifolia]